MNEGVADGRIAYLTAFLEGLRPDPEMWVDEWADAHMVIPKKAGAAEPGPYRTDRTPYAREVMRALSPGHPCRRVVVKGASQLLKTQVALNWIGASIHQAPANILVLLPTEKLVKRLSHRLGETIKAVPVLDARVAPPRSRDSRNTIDTKEFDGGTLYLATSRSASNLSEISCRYVYGDETDRWETDVGGEGDPIELAEARTSTFGTAKLYFTSSPTIEGLSIIDALYRQGDQRRYFVPCPHCGHFQALEWERMHWNPDLTRAFAVCPECGAEIDEHHKTDLLARGEWRAEAAGDGATVSFELSQLYAPPGWTDWLTLAKKYTAAKKALDRGDKGPMQVFYNTRLALSFDAADERAKAADLKARAEDYPLRTLPRGALILTAAVDVQSNRLECLLMGWGEGLERWVIDHRVLWGSPAEGAVWAELDEILTAPIPSSAGRPVQITATCIDSGGHHTQEVYDFARRRKQRKVLAVKGASRPGRPIIAQKPSKVDVNQRGRIERAGAELWMIGADTAKDWLSSRWMIGQGPGAIHFSRELPDDFYDQIVAERKLIRYRKGFPVAEWIKSPGDRNEALDLCTYNLAAAYFLGLNRRRDHDWARLREQIDPATADLFALPPATQARPPAMPASTAPAQPPATSPAASPRRPPDEETPGCRYYIPG